MAFFSSVIFSEQVEISMLYTKKFWFRVLFIFVLGYIVRFIIIKYLGSKFVIDYLNPVYMGHYLSIIVTSIFSEELLNTDLPDKCSMDSTSGSTRSNVGSSTGSDTSGSGRSSPAANSNGSVRGLLLLQKCVTLLGFGIGRSKSGT